MTRNSPENGEQVSMIGHILVVDDNRMNRLSLGHNLEEQGHIISLAEDGYQALEKMRSESFDLILLDIVMPGLDGFQVLEQIKGDATLKDIPVIVISAVDEIDSAVRCIEMGAEDYLPKPFSPVLLRARLRASLEKKKLRDLEQAYLQQELMLRENERLATLGKLSAGMAHELNNPAAAALRASGQMKSSISELRAVQLRLGELELNDDQRRVLAELEQMVRTRVAEPISLDPLSASDAEAGLEQWLNEQRVTQGWEYAPTLVRLGFGSSELVALREHFTVDLLDLVLAWLTCTYGVYSLVETVTRGVNRVVDLIEALKSYTYMDQAPVQLVDVRDGLEATLAMLQSSIGKDVRIYLEYSEYLPRIEAHGSELNQVWTHLLRNAIEAVGASGTITIRAHQRDDWLVVTFEDDGPGILQSNQSRIFDPFFTTKPPGAGAGLGLNISHHIIVQKHQGRITVKSEPGRTCFEVLLPTFSVPYPG